MQQQQQQKQQKSKGKDEIHGMTRNTLLQPAAAAVTAIADTLQISLEMHRKR